MGKVLQKKKNRSSASRVKQKSKRTKTGAKKINVFANAIIKKNWDNNLTFTQNYRRLGLTSRLNAPTGGTEKRVDKDTGISKNEYFNDPLQISLSNSKSKTVTLGEVQVERDPKTGKILRVIRPEEDNDTMIEVAGRRLPKRNPLNDPLEESQDSASVLGHLNHSTASSAVIAELEKQAAVEGEKLMKKKPRHQSKREEEWLERLTEKYGDDTRAMARDKRLNPMQQTEADISRRLKKWKRNID